MSGAMDCRDGHHTDSGGGPAGGILDGGVEDISNLCEPDSLIRMIAESSTDAIFVKDLHGRYLMVNSVVERVCGIAADRIVGATDDELFSCEDARQIHEADLRAIETGQTQEIWETLETSIGTRQYHTFKRPFRDKSGKIIGLVGVAKDVTENKATSRELEMSEQRLRLALESANQGLWDWKPKTNEVYRGDNWYAMLGFKPEDIGGHDRAFDTLAHPADRDRVHAIIDDAMNAGRDGYEAEYRLLTRCGRWKWVRETGRVIERDDDGSASRLVGVIIDIDVHKNAERTMAHARDLAESANKAKSAFLANITHELRTPLTAIIGYAEILAGDIRGEMSTRSRCESAEIIRRNGEFLLQMVNDLLDVSKIEAGKMSLIRQCTSPIEPAEDVVELLKDQASSKGLTLRLETGDRLPETIETDPNRLRQILTNIIGNAIKFTMTGSVTIRIEPVAHDPSRITYTVADTGIGLTSEQIGRLFKPFQQAEHSTETEFGGTGLGLVISKQLAEQLGGDISVESTFGSGSSFTITIGTGEVIETEQAEEAEEDVVCHEPQGPAMPLS
ncbi:MAG TPA: PAS domain S-box protein, partial [Phycisphaerales bacterium]|nr:PAS domain S-box protein [Phycisphaerales bacterium]